MAKGRTNKQGGASVALTGDAVIAEVLNSKTFYNTDPNTKLTGTMPNKVGSATVITPSTVDQTIPQGYYGGAAGDGKVSGDANLVAGNIKSGVNIFNVTGTYTGSGLTGYKGQISQVNFNHASYPIAIACSSDGKYIFVMSTTGGANQYFHRSTDFGQTFTLIDTQSIIPNYPCIACSASGQYVAFTYGNSSGYFKFSSDYGANFSLKQPVSTTWVVQKIAINESGQYVFANYNNTSGFWRSSNYGASFSKIYSIGENSDFDCSSDGATLFYIDPDYGSGRTIRKSTDYGSSFTSILTGTKQPQIMCSADGNYFGYGSGTLLYRRKVSDSSQTLISSVLNQGGGYFMGRDAILSILSSDTTISSGHYLCTVYNTDLTNTTTTINKAFHSTSSVGPGSCFCRGKFGAFIISNNSAYIIQTTA